MSPLLQWQAIIIIYCMSVCSLSSVARSVHAPYYIVTDNTVGSQINNVY